MEFLNGTRFIGGKRSGVDWYRVEILRIESGGAIGYLRFFFFFLNMITKLEN